MTRLTLALAAWMALVSLAPASLTPRKQRQPADAGVLPLRALAPPSLAPGRVAGPATASEFVVTEQTEVLLDGKACRYADVPARATVLRMEVAPDGKTVLRIQFRTGR